MPFDPSSITPDTAAPSEPVPPSPAGRFDPSTAAAVAPSAAAETGFTVPKLARTLAQGWVLDPVEGAAQMAGHLPYVGSTLQSLVPQGVSDWTTQFKKEATAEPWQQYTRLGADIINPLFMIPGVSELGLGRLANLARTGTGVASRVGRAALGGAGRRGALAGAAGATLQPEEGEFSWGRKAGEATGGLVLGGALGHLAGAARGRSAIEEANRLASEAHTGAQAAHQQALAAHDTATAARQTQMNAIRDAHDRNVQQWRTASAQHQATVDAANQAHTAQVTAWRTPQHYHPFTIEQYRDILEPIGQSAQAPTTVGIPQLDQVRNLVGNELNRVNSQLQFQATGDFMLHAEQIRDAAGGDLMHEATQREWYHEPPPTGPVGNRRLPMPSGIYEKYVLDPLRKNPNMSGRQFQEYVSSIDKQADRLADSSPANPYYQDHLRMADALRSISDRIEEHTTPLGGPQDWQRLTDARTNARASYHRWSIMNDATKAQTAGVAKPSDVIGAWQKRIGRTHYGQTWDARKQALQDHMSRLEGPPPAAPILPPAPTRPLAPTRSQLPPRVGRAPRAPVAPTLQNVPPRTMGERIAARAGPLLGGTLGYSIGRKSGVGPYLSTALGAGVGSLLDPVGAAVGRFPFALGGPGGEIGGTAADIVLPDVNVRANR